ncbi:MAG: pyridoxamine 5'-phosphate oxidase family protein [Eubacterium sp.]|nr:pyridoxamine 5'-phosphate oxidase family protein [Eubacterium sp.]
MNSYEKAISIIEEIFSKDYQFALATAVDNIPTLRFVDAYFDKGSFYIVTNEKTNKVKHISVNPNVSLCSRMGYTFSGKAYNIGHPLLPENCEIRTKLINAFETWYFKHNNENDSICILRIDLENGFVHKNGIGYNVDFINETVESFSFVFDTVLTNE